MKIGFSFGRCIRDIVNGEVDINDVAFLITATRIRDEEHVSQVIGTYMDERTYLMGLDYDKCMEVALALWNSHRVLQPRAQGMHRHMQPESSIWVDISPLLSAIMNQSKKPGTDIDLCYIW